MKFSVHSAQGAWAKCTARDTRLGRDVAIKVLPAAVAADPDRLRRFEQEARAIAALIHPHICQIYDVGPAYLVLEYIEGAPVQGPLPVEASLRVAIQIASALEAAHARGILHRDLKPGNILMTRTGHVKVLDFGLAKSIAADADVTRTTAGAVMGTPAYMSPEQAEGKPLDVRSDIFSLGAVVYELLSGTRAFGGDTTAQVVSAVLRDAPPPLQAPLAGSSSSTCHMSPMSRSRSLGSFSRHFLNSRSIERGTPSHRGSA
jgi:serine/threonine protein kinase